MQITKAMELVASSKLRKAKERQERCRPYFMGLKQTLESIIDLDILPQVFAKCKPFFENSIIFYFLMGTPAGFAP